MNPFTCSLALLVSTALGGGDPRPLPVTMQDDALLLSRPPAQVQANARRMALLGVDRVRLTAGWSTLAPRPTSRLAPRFDARDSAAYPRRPWRKLDTAVRAVVAAGLEPQIDIAFFAPKWAVRRVVWTRTPGRNRWEPDPRRFAEFAHAVAERYDGAHRDAAGRELPAVRLWTAWNEPNHPAFLLPQWTRVHGSWVPRSPHVYRTLHERAYSAIKAASPANKVLLGGLSAEGMPGRGARRTIPPLHFLRELACVDRRLRPITAGRCRNFRPLEGDGFAQHPYSLYSAPNVPSAEPDYVRMGDLGDLSALLEALYQRGRLASRMPIYVTEYGYETNPPDIVRGVGLREQARYLGQATYMAWSQPDVASFAQFLLNDIPPPEGSSGVEASANWQSGLYFHDGRAKPAVRAFKLPFWAEAREVGGEDVVVAFGQVRPPDGAQQVRIETLWSDGRWRPVRSLETRPAATDPTCAGSETFMTDEEGFFLRLVPYEGELSYRARWIKADGSSEHGVPVTVGRPDPFPTDS